MPGTRKHARRITRTCLVAIAVAMAALLPASSARAQGLFPLWAAAIAQNQSTSPPQSAAQPAAPPSGSQNQSTPRQTQETQKKNDRMFYVMPNYLTVQN